MDENLSKSKDSPQMKTKGRIHAQQAGNRTVQPTADKTEKKWNDSCRTSTKSYSPTYR